MCLSPNLLPVKGFKAWLPCGKCFECLQARAKEWAYRISLEAKQYKHNCMITLTYNEDNLPEGGFLVKRDLQLFMKRLRDYYSGVKIRFFACGEYGSLNGRPHFHIILFNHDFEDKYFFCKDKKGVNLYRSPTLEKLWHNGVKTGLYYDKHKKQPIYESMGFSSVGEVNFETAKYVAIYMQKPPKDGRPKQFTLMSRRPGIGAEATRKQWLESDKIYFNGKYIKIPRYFLDRLARDYPLEVEALKNRRLDKLYQESLKSDIQARKDLEERVRKIIKLYKIFGKDFEKYFEFDIPLKNLEEFAKNT